jgi:uncharacterized protein (TIGR01244 family)
MADIRRVTLDFAVAPQLAPADVAEVASQGFKLVINNRPDGEVDFQPTSADLEQAANKVGLGYVHVPVRGAPTQAQVRDVEAAIASAEGPVLAFCRSGTRSIVTWALGQASGGADRDALIAQGRNAGYDLSGVLG